MVYVFKYVFGAVFLLAPFLAYPAILEVPEDYSTIQAAVDAADDGDTVLIANGIYTGDGNRGISWDATSRHLVIRSGNGRDHCILDCQGEDRAFLLNQGQDRRDVIEGLTITNGFIFGPGGAISIVSTSPRILDCIMENNTSHCINLDSYYGGGAIAVYDSAAPYIKGNIIRNNSTCNLGGGIRYDQQASGVLENNIIEGNKSNSIGGGGISLSHFSNPLIINNLIIGNIADCPSYGGYGGGIYSSHSGPMIINNTIAYNSTGNFFNPGKGGGIAISKWSPQPIIKNCIIWSNESGASSMNIQFEWNQWMDISYCNVEEDLGHIFDLLPHTNIDSPPKFADPENGNFHLLPNSPSVNTGTPDTSGLYLPAKDLAGRDRIIEARVDMGAYEYNQATGVTTNIQKQIFRVYPNPGTGLMVLECLCEASPCDMIVKILDVSGKLVFEEKVDGGQRTIPITISQQADGIYFLNVLSGGQVLYRQKIVKN